MPQKIDVHGLFIDPESITDLMLQKRISVFYPVFYEVLPAKATAKAVMRALNRRTASPLQHILQFDHLEPYGIILADMEQPDVASYVVSFKQAVMNKLFKGALKVGKDVTGHIAEALKIEVSGDRQYRILQSGRIVKETSIREIPAKVRLLNGQWVDVFKSSPDYDFQGGSPYAVTDVGASALMITTKDKCFVLFGAGIDASNEEVISAYHSLIGIYNEIQNLRGSKVVDNQKKPLIQLPQIKIQLPPVLSKKQDKTLSEALGEPGSDTIPANKQEE